MPSVETIGISAGRGDDLENAVRRVEELAGEHGIDVVEEGPDLEVVLGGDGTILRALRRHLGTRTPVIGVNYGRVGFLASVGRDDQDAGLARAFQGEFEILELPTVEAELGGERLAAVNDVVVSSAVVGRMIELRWAISGEELGAVPCDGLICATPTGSTAYNLSNNGPVLVWGLDAMAVTFIAPHSLHARPLVVPRSRELEVTSLTAGVEIAVLVDGQHIGVLDEDESVRIRLAETRSLLATLPEATFFSRYHKTFTT